MTTEAATALIIAVTGLVTALGVISVQLRQQHTMIDGRMRDLLGATKLASQKAGELDGRDEERARSLAAPPAAEAQTELPTGKP